MLVKSKFSLFFPSGPSRYPAQSDRVRCLAIQNHHCHPESSAPKHTVVHRKSKITHTTPHHPHGAHVPQTHRLTQTISILLEHFLSARDERRQFTAHRRAHHLLRLADKHFELRRFGWRPIELRSDADGISQIKFKLVDHSLYRKNFAALILCCRMFRRIKRKIIQTNQNWMVLSWMGNIERDHLTSQWSTLVATVFADRSAENRCVPVVRLRCRPESNPVQLSADGDWLSWGKWQLMHCLWIWWPNVCRLGPRQCFGLGRRRPRCQPELLLGWPQVRQTLVLMWLIKRNETTLTVISRSKLYLSTAHL